MIGHAYPVADTGYSVLEEGELNRHTLSLDVQCFRVANPRGELLETRYASLVEAQTAALCLVSEQTPAASLKNPI